MSGSALEKEEAEVDVDELIAEGLHSEEMQCLLAELPSDSTDNAASAFAQKKLDEKVMQSWLSDGSDSSDIYRSDSELHDQQLQSGESDMEEFPAVSDDFGGAEYFAKYKELEMKAEEKKSGIPFTISHAKNQEEEVDKGGEKNAQNTLETSGGRVNDDKESDKYLRNTLETKDGQVDEDDEFGKYLRNTLETQDGQVDEDDGFGKYLRSALEKQDGQVDEDKEFGKYLRNTLETQDGQVDEDEEFGKYLQNTLETVGDLTKSDLNQLYTSPVRIQKTSPKDPENAVEPNADSELGKRNMNDSLMEGIKNPHSLVKESSNTVEERFNVSHVINIETTIPDTIPKPISSPESDQVVREFPQKSIEKLRDSPTSILQELCAFPIKNEEKNSDVSEAKFVLKLNTEAEQTVSSNFLKETLEHSCDLSHIDLGNVQTNPAEDQAKKLNIELAKDQVFHPESKEAKKDVRLDEDVEKLYLPLITGTSDETKKMLKNIEGDIVEVKNQKNLKQIQDEDVEKLDLPLITGTSDETKKSLKNIEGDIVEVENQKNLKQIQDEDVEKLYLPLITGSLDEIQKSLKNIEGDIVEVKHQKNLKEIPEEDVEKLHSPLITGTLDETGKMPKKLEEGIVEAKNEKNLKESGAENVEPKHKHLATKTEFPNEVESKNRKEIFTLRHSDGDSVTPRISEAQAVFLANTMEKRTEIEPPVKMEDCVDEAHVKLQKSDMQIFWPEASEGFESIAEDTQTVSAESHGKIILNVETCTSVALKAKCLADFAPESDEGLTKTEYLPNEPTSSYRDKIVKTDHETQPDQDDVAPSDRMKTAHRTNTSLRQQNLHKSSDVKTEASAKEPASESKKKPGNKITKFLRCLRKGNSKSAAS